MPASPTANIDADPVDVRAGAQDLLERLAGPDARLRDDQGEAIEALVRDRARVLLVQRTGWGKSAVYWIATALRRAQGGGPTLVVSPLLALMRDQVAAARRLGLAAETINSTNLDDWQDILARLDDDAIDVLLISPERLNAASFRDRLPALAARLGLLVVDEAHCISDWGHDFRPDYRRIADLLGDLADGTPVLACTATANARVTTDVARQLDPQSDPGADPGDGGASGDRDLDDTDVVTLRGRLGRDSLQLAVVRLDRGEQRLAWLDAFVRRHRPVHGRAGIVYTLTVADSERVAAFLAGRGLEAVAYNSNVDPDGRRTIEDRLLANDVDVVVSTSALGMGYDKPDLAFVVHLGAPSSPVSWYQQVGRAGRAIETAEVVLLPTGKDEAIWQHFDVAGLPRESEVQALLDALDGGSLSVPKLERAVNVRRSRLQLLLKVLDVDGAVEKVGSAWQRTGVDWQLDVGHYQRLADLRRREHAIMRSFVEGGGGSDGSDGSDGRDGRDGGRCLMQALGEVLDDPDAQPCGRCQGCTGWEPDVEIDEQVVAEAREHLRTRDVVVGQRRMWPSGLDEVKGRIDAGRGALQGRALAGGDGSGWDDVVDRLLASSEAGDLDATALDEVVEGLTRVLARWSWSRRPVAFVPVPSGRHGELAAEVARRMGELGRLPVVAALVDTDAPPQRTMANSPHKAANALRGLALDPAAAADVPDGPVVLVDAITDSGWTLVAAAHRLTEAGERDVLPLVLSAGP
ncbi:DEAD/DEAH box helicase [Salsipaludibacter albus]|uniref:DEAD/DEAH box helicase n=1 Tax=Salsipaludibacter albus TaxID=2849650 RepID=UPI001EE4273B